MPISQLIEESATTLKMDYTWEPINRTRPNYTPRAFKIFVENVMNNPLREYRYKWVGITNEYLVNNDEVELSVNITNQVREFVDQHLDEYPSDRLFDQDIDDLFTYIFRDFVGKRVNEALANKDRKIDY